MEPSSYKVTSPSLRIVNSCSAITSTTVNSQSWEAPSEPESWTKASTACLLSSEKSRGLEKYAIQTASGWSWYSGAPPMMDTNRRGRAQGSRSEDIAPPPTACSCGSDLGGLVSAGLRGRRLQRLCAPERSTSRSHFGWTAPTPEPCRGSVALMAAACGEARPGNGMRIRGGRHEFRTSWESEPGLNGHR